MLDVMTGIDQLLALANAYIAAEGIEMHTLSWRALGDSKKLASLADGKDIQVKRFERALAWFDEHWPEGVEWPAGVQRPRRGEAAA
jgi:hypothetical protein